MGTTTFHRQKIEYIDIDEKEIKALIDLIGPMNSYDMMAILCRIYEDESEMKEVMERLAVVFRKLSSYVKQ